MRKQAYKTLVVKYHPDKLSNPRKSDKEKFHAIQEAYEELTKKKEPEVVHKADQSYSRQSHSQPRQDAYTQFNQSQADRPADPKEWGFYEKFCIKGLQVAKSLKDRCTNRYWHFSRTL